MISASTIHRCLSFTSLVEALVYSQG